MPRAPKAGTRSDSWDLHLYVAGKTPKARAALGNLKLICEEGQIQYQCD